MAPAMTLRNHRICGDPVATMVLPTAWRRLLSKDGPDTGAMSALAGQIHDTNSSASFATMVRSRIEVARVSGASFAAMMSGDGDVPVAASIVVAPLAALPTSVVDLDVQWRTRPAREIRRVSLPVGPALVGSALREVAVDDVSTADVYEWQIAIPHHASGGVLLAFSTPLTPLAEMFDDVFLTIAKTVRWHKDWRV